MLFDTLERARLDALDGLVKQAELPTVVDRMALSFEVPPKRKASDYLRAATGWVYACASVIADEVAQIGLRLFKPSGDDNRQELHAHPILDLLHRANLHTTKFDLFWLTQQYLELTGEAPWFLSRTEAGIPTGIYLLKPDRLSILPSKDKTRLIEGYRYQVDYNNFVDLTPDELVFLKYPDPDSQFSFRGKGTLQAVAKTVDIDDFSEEFNRKFFYNSARPDSIFRTDASLTKAQREQLKDSIKKNFQGVSNAHKTIVLEAGLDWKPMQLSQKDMDFLEQQRFSRDKILGVFRVPRTALGITDDVNRANAEATDYVFARRTIKPKMQRLVEMLNEFLVPQFDTAGSGLFLSYDDPVPEDVEKDARVSEVLIRAGAKTINEVRSANGDEPVDGGDVPYIPLNLVPLGMSLSEPAAGGQPKRFGPLEYQGRMRRRRSQTVQKRIEELAYGRVLPLVAAQFKGRKKARAKNKDEERNERFWKAQTDIALRFETLLKRKIAATLRAQKNQILSRIPTKGVEDDAVLDIDSETDAMVKIYSPILDELMKMSGAEAIAFVGGTGFDPDSPRVREYLRQRVFRFSFEMNEETNRRVARTLAQGVRGGESIPQLRSRISGLFSDMEKFRSERIARSETIRASNAATVEAYKQSGVVHAKEWLTAFDERTCPYCEAMNGKIIELDDNFFDKGDSIGDLPLDYDNVEYPPLHPNCRCTIIPILK